MIEINKKYGCLAVLDMGEEYKTLDNYSYRKLKVIHMKN